MRPSILRYRSSRVRRSSRMRSQTFWAEGESPSWKRTYSGKRVGSMSRISAIFSRVSRMPGNATLPLRMR
ncbi:hypothetical protein D3C87_1699190 [compost metagenome]